MGIIEILFIAVGLAMDAFAASLAIGTVALRTAAANGKSLLVPRRADSLRQMGRVGFHFGFFQFFMPVVGWYAGRQVATHIARYDHWVAFALLAAVGAHMIYSGLSAGEANSIDRSRGWSLIVLSIATSIDALAVGFSLALIAVPIWFPSIVIGIVTAVLSGAGVLLGRRMGTRFGKPMEIAGGLVLVLIGLRILLTHLAS